MKKVNAAMAFVLLGCPLGAQAQLNGLTCAQFSTNPTCIQQAQQQAVQTAVAAQPQQAAPAPALAAPAAGANQNSSAAGLQISPAVYDPNANKQPSAPAAYGQIVQHTLGAPRLQPAQGKAFGSKPKSPAANPKSANGKPRLKVGVDSRFQDLSTQTSSRKTLQPFTPRSDIGAQINPVETGATQIGAVNAGGGAAAAKTSGAGQQPAAKPKVRGGPVYGPAPKTTNVGN